MGRFKRIIGTAVCGAIVCSTVLSGCTQKTAVNEEKQPVKLIWCLPNADSSSAEQAEKVQGEFNRILEQKYNTTIDFVQMNYSDYDQKMKLRVAAGEPWDLCYTASFKFNYIQFASKGTFLALDDYIGKYAEHTKKTIPESIWNAAKVKGKLYAVPNYQLSCLTNAIVLQKEFADKIGFDASQVKTLSDLEPYLENFKKEMPNKVPFVLSLKNPIWGNLVLSQGFDELTGRNIPGTIRVKDDSLKVVNQFETEEFKSFIKLMRSWYNKGYMPKDLVSDSPIAPADTGAMAVGNYGPNQEAMFKIDRGFEGVYAKVSEPVMLTSSILSALTAVNVNTENPERAVEFIDIINKDKELFNVLAFGLQDTHYKKLEDGTVEWIKTSGYKLQGRSWTMGSTFNLFVQKSVPTTIWEDTKKWNESAKASPALGFSFVADNVSNEIAQCKAVVDEFLPGLASGYIDPEAYLPKFIEKLKTAGVDKVIAETQKQIDEWKKTKN